MTAIDETAVQFRRACPVCGGMRGELLYRQRFARDNNASSLEGYDVVACDTCGLTFADGIPDQQWFDSYYGEFSKYEDAARGGRESPWEVEKFRVVAKAMTPYVPSRSAQIVEIGCSTGRQLHFLRQAGFDRLLGVDPSPTSARLAMQRFEIEVRTGTFSKLDLRDGIADFLVLCGVLEHVRDLGQALDTIARLTGSLGRVFVSVPDASRYAEGEDAPFQEFSMEHINFFGPRSLSNLMATRGFTPVAMIADTLDVNLRTKTPVIHGVFSKATSHLDSTYDIPKDTETVDGLKDYIAKCRDEDRRIQEVIARLAEKRNPILVWGVGTHTLRLLAESSLGQANITAFVDSNPSYQGRRLLNLPVCSPEILRQHPDVPVLISSRAFQEEIAEEIVHSMKCANPLVRLYSLCET